MSTVYHKTICHKKEPLLISACLLGEMCRYDGKSKDCPIVRCLEDRYDFIPVCPECLGGLPCPRPPAERRGDTVVSRTGQNVTAAFYRGAEKALTIARAHGVKKALLKERSPSCGFGTIHDGMFTGTLRPGNGVAAELLSAAGIAIFGESQWEVL